MTSAAEKYGKVPDALSAEARQRVLEAGQALKQQQVTHDGSVVSAPSRPAPTPPPQHSNGNDTPQRGLSR